MSWFKDDSDTLKSRNWNPSDASSVEDRPGCGYGTRETHERVDGTYIVEKDSSGRVVSVTKK